MIFLFFVSRVLAVDATPAIINPNLPGTESIATGGPLAIIANFYNFALMIGGVLAFGMILYGAVKYMIAAGNPGGQSDAKDQITQALLGLLLLVGAYVVLNTINPALTHPTLPTLKPLPPAPGLSGGTPNAPDSGCYGNHLGGCTFPLQCKQQPDNTYRCVEPTNALVQCVDGETQLVVGCFESVATCQNTCLPNHPGGTCTVASQCTVQQH